MKSIKLFSKSLFALLALTFVAANMNLKAEHGEYYPAEVSIIMQPSHIVECVGTPDLNFSVIAASSDTDYELVYRWWKDGQPITPVMEENGLLPLDDLTFDMSGDYVCEIWAFDPYGHMDYYEARVSEIVYTDAKQLYVLQEAQFLSDIQDYKVNEGADLSITFDAHIYGEHNMEDPTYYTGIQWYKDSVALENGDRVWGVNSSILTISDAQASDYGDYYVVLTGNCNQVSSNEFTISEVPSASFTTMPMSTDGCLNDEVTLTAEAEASDGSGVVYRWWMDGMMLENEAGAFAGVNTNTLTVTLSDELDLDGTEEFVCQAWPTGYQENAVISDVANVDVNTAPVLTTDLNTTYEVAEDEEVTMMVEAAGEDLAYQWYKDGTAITDATSNSITIETATTDDAGEYNVEINNTCGTISSTTATLTVNAGTIISSVTTDKGQTGLHQNSPNPFRSVTTITFRANTTTPARVTITDNLGNTVATVYNGTAQPGLNTIEINSNDLGLQSGTYFYSLEMGNKVQSSQMILIK